MSCLAMACVPCGGEGASELALVGGVVARGGGGGHSEGMNPPTPEQIEAAEQAAVRVALAQGFLQPRDVREALLLREQLKQAGRPSGLLAVLGARSLRPEHRPLLSEVYFRSLREAAATPAAPAAPPPVPSVPQAMSLETSSDELAIPEFALQASSEQLERPAEDDPEEIREFMAKSSEFVMPPPEPSPDPDDSAERSASGIWRWFRRKSGG